MRKIVFILFLFPILGLANNDHYKGLFTQANTQYENGNFDSSLVLYNQIYRANLHSFELCFNIGNAYFKTGNIPMAILLYERAEKIKPGNKDLAHNLEIANGQIVDKIESIPTFFLNRWWNDLANTFTLNTWFWLLIVSFIVTLSSLALFIRSKQSSLKQLGFFGLSIFGLGFFLTLALTLTRKGVEFDHSKGIIMQPSLTVHSEPSENSTELFLLHEGTKVEQLETHNNWSKIALPDGNIGWVRSSTFEII